LSCVNRNTNPTNSSIKPLNNQSDYSDTNSSSSTITPLNNRINYSGTNSSSSTITPLNNRRDHSQFENAYYNGLEQQYRNQHNLADVLNEFLDSSTPSTSIALFVTTNILKNFAFKRINIVKIVHNIINYIKSNYLNIIKTLFMFLLFILLSMYVNLDYLHNTDSLALGFTIIPFF
jgi:hypothetical protein